MGLILRHFPSSVPITSIIAVQVKHSGVRAPDESTQMEETAAAHRAVMRTICRMQRIYDHFLSRHPSPTPA